LKESWKELTPGKELTSVKFVKKLINEKGVKKEEIKSFIVDLFN
jgi:hypothetical protein